MNGCVRKKQKSDFSFEGWLKPGVMHKPSYSTNEQYKKSLRILAKANSDE